MNILHLDLPRVARVERSVHDDTTPPASFDTQANIRRVAATGRGAVSRRLQELDDEWTIEGIFEMSAAIVGMITFGLGLAVDDLWLVLPLLVSVLLLQQTLQGWCPVLPLLRGLGFRTERELNFERHALLEIEEELAEQHCPGRVMPRTRSQEPTWNVPADGRPAGSSSFSLRDFLIGAPQ